MKKILTPLPLPSTHPPVWVWVLAMQVLLLLVLVKLPLYQKQILRSRQEWFAFLGTHVNAPMISLNSRLYSLPEYEAGWPPKSHTVAA
jgi:hypothetical protein